MGKLQALVVLAEGAEEMEAVISIDVLRRAGIEVTTAGLESGDNVKCSKEVIIKPDCSLKDALGNKTFDAIVLPGGLKGAENLANSVTVGTMLKEQEASGRLIAAICAAPAVTLLPHGIGVGKNVTCYPAFEEQITASGKYTFKNQHVVLDGSLLTSQGPGTAFEFALAIVEKLLGKDVSDATAKPMLL